MKKKRVARVAAAVVGALVLVTTSLALTPSIAKAATQDVDDFTTSGTNHFNYDSSWGNATGVSDLSNGTAHWSRGPNGVATFVFSGTAVVIHGVKDVDQGISTFSLDGGTAVTVDDYAATRAAQSTLYTSATVANGTHTLTITATGTKNASSSGTTVAIDFATVTAPDTGIPSGSLIADLSQSTGAFIGGASGTLYGQYDETAPTPNVAEGMGLLSNATKAQDGFNHPGADAIEVNRPLTQIGGYTAIYMMDWFRSFPVDPPGATAADKLNNLLARYQQELNQIKTLPAAEQANFVYIPFNENSVVNTRTDDPAFYSAWDQAYALIKGQMGSSARIAGLNTAGSFDQNAGMLQHMVQANDLPDIYTWHELGSPSDINQDVQTFRNWETQYYAGTAMAGKHLPINIDEYGAKNNVGVPGAQVRWIAALENNKMYGDMGYYNIQGNLNETAVGSNRGNSQFWLFNSYSQMSGNTVPVTTPSIDYNNTVQAIATLDTTKKQARMVFGGGSGTQNVAFSNIPTSTFGTSVHAQVREIAYSGPFGDSAPPNVIGQLDLTVTNGNVQFAFDGSTLPQLKSDSAYEVILTPRAGAASSQAANRVAFKGIYEFENAACTGTCTVNQTNKFYNSGGANVGGFDSTANTTRTFNVTVPTTGTYTVSLFGNSPYTNSFVPDYDGPVNVFVRADNSASTEKQVYLSVANDWELWGHSETTMSLTAGAHTITVATRSLNGTSQTIGGAILDKMELTLPNSSYTAETYEAEYGSKIGGTISYVAGKSGPGVVNLTNGKSVTFWVYSAAEASSVITVGADSTAYTVSVNGNNLGQSSGHSVALEGGINKVVVTATGTLALDLITVAPATVSSTTYQAESAALAGSAAATNHTQATGGKDVTGIGGAPNNTNTVTFTVSVATAGTYAMDVRYANGETSQAYNPYNAAVDPVDRTAYISVNGGTAVMRTFPTTFHANSFQDLTQYVTLKAGNNTIKFSGHERPLFDGTTLISSFTSDGQTSIDPNASPLRSKFAPDLDSIRISPLVTN